MTAVKAPPSAVGYGWGMHIPWFSLGGAVAVALLCCCPAPGSAVDDPVELRLEPLAGPFRAVAGTVAGQPRRFLFDSGGGGTVLAVAAAKAAGVERFGRATGFRHDGERVDGSRGTPVALAFGSFTRRGEVGVLDLAHLLADLPPVDGIVSLETFAARPFTLDLGHDRLVLETAPSLAVRCAGAVRLEVRCAHQAGGASLDVFVAVAGRHGRQWFELDSGNAAPVLVAPHALAELGIELPASGAAREATLDVPGLGAVPIACSRKEMIYDGVLNAEFCRRFAFTFDVATGSVWARRS